MNQRHETSDMDPKYIAYFAAALVVVGILVHIALWWMFHQFEEQQARRRVGDEGIIDGDTLAVLVGLTGYVAGRQAQRVDPVPQGGDVPGGDPAAGIVLVGNGTIVPWLLSTASAPRRESSLQRRWREGERRCGKIPTTAVAEGEKARRCQICTM